MKSRFLLFLFSVVCCWNQTWSLALAQDVSGKPDRAVALTLAQALKRVADQNPELAVSELEIQAVTARISQAGVKPNPEVELMAENLSFPFVGAGLFHYTESTLQVSHRLELGGKRDLRIRAAEKEVTVAARELEVMKAELFTATAQAFAELLVEQERVTNQHELNRLTQQSYAIVVERVAAGKVSPVEQTRASVALASAQLEEEKHKRLLDAAKDRLAALWGGSRTDIDSVLGKFEIPPVATNLQESCMQANPEIRLAAAAADSRNAALALEIANRKPDLTLNAGLRRLNPENEQVWVAGVSIPLPIFDKRVGAIAEARTRLEQSRMQEKAVAWRLRSALTQATHEHESALLEAKSLSESALPAAREAAAAVEEGYRLGKFEFLNVLDAQRTLAELQGKYIEAVASGLKAAILIERIARCDTSALPVRPAK
jgi:cobalt-zinc-cadmium efflux system outer membrane protein